MQRAGTRRPGPRREDLRKRRRRGRVSRRTARGSRTCRSGRRSRPPGSAAAAGARGRPRRCRRRLTLPSDRGRNPDGWISPSWATNTIPLPSRVPFVCALSGEVGLAELGPQRGGEPLVERPRAVGRAAFAAPGPSCARIRRRDGRTGPRRCARSCRSGRRRRGSGRRPRSAPASARREQGRDRPGQEEHLPDRGARLFHDPGDRGELLDVVTHDDRVHLHCDPVPAKAVDGRQRGRELALDTAHALRASRPWPHRG